ncbi:MAG: hemerythrin domain-containing protein [Polyangiaceae bacterium]|jgi:hypothetical protein
MQAPLAAAPRIRDRFLADHRGLEASIESLVQRLAANDRSETSRRWREFERRLLGHLDAEEAALIPALFDASERDARILVQEHRHLRARLLELGAGLESRGLPVGGLRNFVDELRAHAQTEDRLLYLWADAHVDEARLPQALSALTGETTAK